jgi:hypothetical protein
MGGQPIVAHLPYLCEKGKKVGEEKRKKKGKRRRERGNLMSPFLVYYISS